MTTNPLTPERQRAITDNYKSMLGHYAEAKRKSHQAMCHPDVTPEMLWEIHLVAVRVHKTLTDVRASLLAMDWPFCRGVYPWEKPL